MCQAEGCHRLDHHAKGFCNKHYQAFRNYGDPLTKLPMGRFSKFKSLQEKFESKFTKLKPNECWPWLGGLDIDGYGFIHWYQDKKLKKYMAHRLSYQFYMSEFDVNMLICHKCDNPSCINPYHLFLGTAQDNATDMIQKRRSMFGSSNNKAKLTESDVVAIRKRLAEGGGTSSVAREYGVHKDTIRRIKNRSLWKHVN